MSKKRSLIIYILFPLSPLQEILVIVGFSVGNYYLFFGDETHRKKFFFHFSEFFFIFQKNVFFHFSGIFFLLGLGFIITTLSATLTLNLRKQFFSKNEKKHFF